MSIQTDFWSAKPKMQDQYWQEQALTTLEAYWQQVVLPKYEKAKYLMQHGYSQAQVIEAIEGYSLSANYFATYVVSSVAITYLKQGAQLGPSFHCFIQEYTAEVFQNIKLDLEALSELYELPVSAPSTLSI